jgi:hypothetical protein
LLPIPGVDEGGDNLIGLVRSVSAESRREHSREMFDLLV